MNRHNDENITVAKFQNNVDVHCPSCNLKALAVNDLSNGIAKLICTHCGFNKTVAMCAKILNKEVTIIQPASAFFDADLWYTAPFKSDTIQAFNKDHLLYIEAYVKANLREHKQRTGFTLLEKLPKFYHYAKNRNEIIKIIGVLKNK